MTHSDMEVREGSAAAAGAVLVSTAEARAHGREDTPPAASVALDAVTQGAQAARRAVASAAAALDRQGSLLHAQPPTFAQAWARHAECARHYEALLFRWPRYWWGVAHTFVIKPALNFAEVVTASPAWSFVTLAVGLAVWYWG